MVALKVMLALKVMVAVVVYDMASFVSGWRLVIDASIYECMLMHTNNYIIKYFVELHNTKPIGGGTGTKNPILIVCHLMSFAISFE